MKKQFITKGFSDGKSPRIINIEIIEGDCGFSHIEVHCDILELEGLLLKSLVNLTVVKDFNVLSYMRKEGSNLKNVPSYHQDHISLRYFLARKFTPNELLDPFEKIEREMSESFDKFRKSLKPPFDKILND